MDGLIDLDVVARDGTGGDRPRKLAAGKKHVCHLTTVA
jgi:hypothetical protein